MNEKYISGDNLELIVEGLKTSYLENRTHWEENITITHVENLTKAMFENGEAPGCNFVPGNTYSVLWNGVLYDNLVCYFDGEFNIIADRSLGCPFYIDDDGGNGLFIESDGNWTVSIFEKQNVIHKIDKKYLPDEIRNLPDEVQKIQSIMNVDNNGDAFININAAYIGSSEDLENAEKIITEKNFYDPKKYLVVTDEVDGYNYFIATRNGNIVSYIQTKSIAVTTMPNKTIYADHEEFNPKGMVVTAIGVDGSTREITNYTYDIVTAENAHSFVISYNEMGETHTTTISLTMHDFSLIDFNYVTNEDGTYSLTGWKGTYNGEPSTRIVIPNSELIIV